MGWHESLAKGMNCIEIGEYETAAYCISVALDQCPKDRDDILGAIYLQRAIAYNNNNEVDKAIADLKIAADYGNDGALNILNEKLGINYTPQKPSTQSSFKPAYSTASIVKTPAPAVKTLPHPSRGSAFSVNKVFGKIIIVTIIAIVLFFGGRYIYEKFILLLRSNSSAQTVSSQNAQETLFNGMTASNAGWTAFVDGGNNAVKDGTSANISFGRETVQNSETDLMTLTVNLASGSEWRIGEFTLDNDAFIRQFKTANGIRFSVLGDGAGGWRVMFPISQTLSDHCYHETAFSTASGRVTKVDIPFSRLAQPEWGQPVTFNRNNIVSIKIQRHSTDSNFSGSSTIKVFDFEIY